MKTRRYYRILLSLAAVAISGCASSSQTLPYMQNGAPLRALSSSGAGKIDHIIYIIQENRSFDNMFQGYPGADTRSWGFDSKGKKVKLQPVSLSTQYVIDHSAEAMFAACNGTGSVPGTRTFYVGVYLPAPAATNQNNVQGLVSTFGISWHIDQ